MPGVISHGSRLESGFDKRSDNTFDKRNVQRDLIENLMKVVKRGCEKENATSEEVSALAEVAGVIARLLNF